MLSDSDLGVGSLVALIAAVVVVYDISSEPLPVLPFVTASAAGSQVSIRLIEDLGGSDDLLLVHHAHIHILCGLTAILVVGLNPEGEIVGCLLDGEEWLRENPKDLHVAASDDGEVVAEETTDLDLKPRPAV